CRFAGGEGFMSGGADGLGGSSDAAFVVGAETNGDGLVGWGRFSPCSLSHCAATLDLREKLMLVMGRPSAATRAIAVLTAIICPSLSSRGPPELPRFSPVSV